MGINCSIAKNKNNDTCKSRPSALFGYFGGKAKVADKIIAKFPEKQKNTG